MKKLELEKMAQINGGKMFDYVQSCTGCFDGVNVCTTTYKIFWIPFSSTDVIPC